MNPFEIFQAQTRRQMIGLGARGLGALGAASLLNPSLLNAATTEADKNFSGTLNGPHFKPTAKKSNLSVLFWRSLTHGYVRLSSQDA